MITGTAYGVILNDRRQVASMEQVFGQSPYKAPPRAPVLYIKPRTCFGTGGAPVPLPADLPEVEVAATLAVLFSRDLTCGDAAVAENAIGAACLALDVSEPHDEVYRPAIRQRCRDGFLPLGRFGPVPADAGLVIETRINGVPAHRWSLDRLVRPIAALAAELSRFMTLGAGDLLLVGLPGDAPRATSGDVIEIAADGVAPLRTLLVDEVVPAAEMTA